MKGKIFKGMSKDGLLGVASKQTITRKRKRKCKRRWKIWQIEMEKDQEQEAQEQKEKRKDWKKVIVNKRWKNMARRRGMLSGPKGGLIGVASRQTLTKRKKRKCKRRWKRWK